MSEAMGIALNFSLSIKKCDQGTKDERAVPIFVILSTNSSRMEVVVWI